MILPTPALSTDMEDTEDVFVCDYVLRKWPRKNSEICAQYEFANNTMLTYETFFFKASRRVLGIWTGNLFAFFWSLDESVLKKRTIQC